jgi:choline dehydrogenase
MATPHAEFDYVVIGSGAGGGPVAANLAKAGYRVGLIEAGQAPEPAAYSVPAFHGFASEDPDMSWAFFVRHYASGERSKRDWKFRDDRDGVFYPRAGTLGGCTAHHAMITVYGHGSDWDHIADVTGDDSWRADRMRAYFERLEDCGYVDGPGAGQPHPTRHGWGGWLRTTRPDVTLAFGDRALVETCLEAVKRAWAEGLSGRLPDVLPRDPNDWREPRFEGVCFAPVSTLGGRRLGTRELLLGTREAHPDRLVIRMSNLATRILFDDDRRAIGVECWEGERLYRADPNAGADDHAVKRYFASREVILAGGTFNSPQLLMLSGIGPRQHLEQFGIRCLVDRPGVGTNLQDRYEVGVVTEMTKDWDILAGATFAPPLPNQPGDPCYVDWQNGKGVYTTNGAVLGIVRRSGAGPPDPDLFVFAVPGKFEGYYPGYAKDSARARNFLTWTVLKAHTVNTGGLVRLRSADPRDVPAIDFRYFDEGTDVAGADLAAVVDGIEFVRRMNAGNGAIAREVVPGPGVRTRGELAQWVKDHAWGHHASCSNPMGRATDPDAVVDSSFRVIGVERLRVVDASVFPRIPGFFIVTPIYMIAEKASEAIIADAQRGG